METSRYGDGDADTVARTARDDGAGQAREQRAGQATGKRKLTSRQEALQVDGAKVLRTIVMAARKRRLPYVIERVLRQRTQAGKGDGKRKRGDTGDSIRETSREGSASL